MNTVHIITKAALLVALTGIAFAVLTAGVGGLAEARDVQLCAAPVAPACFFAIF